MARFYKTAQAQFIDRNIYTPPVELMAGVIKNADNQIAQNESALLSLYDKLQAQSLQVDEPRLKEIITGYQTQIEDMAKGIQSNPLEFRKEIGNIRQLGRTINNDWTKGEVAAIQSNKGLRDKWVADHLEKTKKEKGYVNQADMTFAQNTFDKQFISKGGTSYQGPGKYNMYNTEALNPFVNIQDLGEERAKGYIADVITQNGAWTDGKYMYTSETSKEKVPFETIKTGVMTAMLNDKELMEYYGQQVRLGAMNTEQFGKLMDAEASRVAEKYSYEKEEKGRKSITGDPFALKQMEIDNQWKLRMADKTDELAGPVIDANIRTGEQLDALNRGYGISLRNLADKIGVTSTRADGRRSPQDVRTKLDLLVRLAKTPEQVKAVHKYQDELKNITNNYNSGQVKASWAGFASVHGNDVATSAMKQFEKYTKDPRNLYDKKMDYKINGRTFKDVTLYDVYNEPWRFGLRPDSFVTTDEFGETTKRDIKELFVQGSQVPVMISDRKEDWMLNDMLFEFEGQDVNIEGQTSFGNLGINYSK